MAGSRISFRAFMVSMSMARSSAEKEGKSMSSILLAVRPMPSARASALVRFRCAGAPASALAAALACLSRYCLPVMCQTS